MASISRGGTVLWFLLSNGFVISSCICFSQVVFGISRSEFRRLVPEASRTASKFSPAIVVV
jgi:hypothetical protein